MTVTHIKLKGSVLGFSIMLLSLLLFSAITLLSVSILERKAGYSTQKSIIAFQGADSAAERVLKRIYIDNSPSLVAVQLNTAMPSPPGDSTLLDLSGNLPATTGTACMNGIVSATNSPSSSPNYMFQVSFFDNTGALIQCDNDEWRDKVVRIRSEGFYQRTSRVVEVGIRPRF